MLGKKILLILILGMFLVSFTCAVSIGTFKQSEDVQLYQTCDDCTYCNFTIIKYPNSSEIITDVETTKRATYFYYDLNGANTSDLGEYTYCYECGDGTNKATGCINFEITGNGKELTDGIATNFNFSMAFLLVFFFLSLIGIFKFENPTGKLACYWVAHVLFVVGTFSVWQFNGGYAIAYTGLAGIFKVLFYVSIIAMFPMVLLSLAWIFYIHVMNDTIKGFMERGMDEQEAHKRAKEKQKW